MNLLKKLGLKQKLAAKNSGFRSVLIEAPDFDNAKLLVKEPPTTDWINYIKVVRDTQENKELTEEQRIELITQAEVKMFIKCVHDENGNKIFDDEKELLEVYGNTHSRILEHALKLLNLNKNPIELAEKK